MSISTRGHGLSRRPVLFVGTGGLVRRCPVVRPLPARSVGWCNATPAVIIQRLFFGAASVREGAGPGGVWGRVVTRTLSFDPAPHDVTVKPCASAWATAASPGNDAICRVPGPFASGMVLPEWAWPGPGEGFAGLGRHGNTWCPSRPVRIGKAHATASCKKAIPGHLAAFATFGSQAAAWDGVTRAAVGAYGVGQTPQAFGLCGGVGVQGA